MKTIVLQLIGDQAGNLSSMRAAMLLGLVIVLGAWLVVSIHQHALQNLPDNILYLLIALISGKAVQKFGETPPVKQP